MHIHDFVFTSLMLFPGDPESKSTKIDWKNGMNLTARTEALVGNDRKRQLGRVKRNFFAWFLDNGDPSADGIAEVSG